MKGSKIVRRNAKTGRPEEQLIFETCYGLSFFENSLLVEDPADPTAFFLGVDKRGLTAKTASRPLAGLGVFVAAAALSEPSEPRTGQFGDEYALVNVHQVKSRPNTYYLHNLWVNPDHRDKGIGTRLMKSITDEHDANGSTLALHTDQPRLQEWYKGMGFEPKERDVFGQVMERPPRTAGLKAFVAASSDEDDDLSTKSPAEIDARLGDHHTKLYGHQGRQASALEQMHHAVGDRQQGRGQGKFWQKSHQEVLNHDPSTLTNPRMARDYARNRTAYDSAGEDAKTEQGHISRYDNEFHKRGGWSRFFLVPDGHIHSSTACHSCRPTTPFSWLPNLSGKSEGEAVEQHGPHLCTHCFKSAPTEWKRDPAETRAEEKKRSGEYCAGGKASSYPDAEERARRKATHPQGKVKLEPGEAMYTGQRGGYQGRCPTCKTIQKVKNSGEFYQHKPPEPPKEEKPKVERPVLPDPGKGLKTHLRQKHQMNTHDFDSYQQYQPDKSLDQIHSDLHEKYDNNQHAPNNHTHGESAPPATTVMTPPREGSWKGLGGFVAAGVGDARPKGPVAGRSYLAASDDQQFDEMYHATSPNVRSSIQQRGLTSEYDEGYGYTEPGIYMSPKPDPSEYSDVWKVNTKGLHLHPDDPSQMHEFRDVGGSYFSKEDIPPERLTFHRPATKHWTPKESAKETEITVAGLAVVARDTGRVLMLQRLLDGKDPAGGTWEFPGGHLDPGESPIEGGIREWKEELGCPLPPGKVGGSWTSKGMYQGHVYVIEREDLVEINDDHEDRRVLNPDDPDGDGIEVAAWWDPQDLPDMPALRPECKTTDWSLFKPAAIAKVAKAEESTEPWYQGAQDYEGAVGNRSHITRNVQMSLPTHLVAHMPGVMDERPGEHRNMTDDKWEDFKHDISANGIKTPLFITVDHGQRPRLSEGNHRRDAAVELGLKHVPAQVRYYGHAERDSDLEDQTRKWWTANPQHLPKEAAKADTYFHVAPREARDSILQHGLNHEMGESSHDPYMSSHDLPRGNYLFRNEDSAWEHKDINDEIDRDNGGEWEPRDVWKVNHKGPVEIDPDLEHEPEHGSVFTQEHIPSHRLKLLTKEAAYDRLGPGQGHYFEPVEEGSDWCAVCGHDRRVTKHPIEPHTGLWAFAREIPKTFFHGTTEDLQPGDVLHPGNEMGLKTHPQLHKWRGDHVWATPEEAGAWGYSEQAETSRGSHHVYGPTVGDRPRPRVYEVEPMGPVQKRRRLSPFDPEEYTMPSARVLRSIDIPHPEVPLPTQGKPSGEGMQGRLPGEKSWENWKTLEPDAADLSEHWELSRRRHPEAWAAGDKEEPAPETDEHQQKLFAARMAALRAFVAVNSSDEVPPPMGESPIPEDHVRLFHQTSVKQAESVRQHGLTMEHARDISGPRGVWASHGTRFYGEGDEHATVEFHVPYDELRDTAGGQSPHRGQPQEDWEKSTHHTLIIPRSIQPHEISAIHLPWHNRYHYFHDNGMTDDVKKGEFDNLSDMKDYGPAIDKIKREALRHLAMNAEDEVPPRLGTAPIPEDHVRLYHHTWSRNVPSIREHGLLAEMGQGDSGKGYGNEASAGVWAASQHPEPDPQSDRHVIEFHAHPREIDVNGPSPGQDIHKWQQGDHNVLMRGSVPKENILAIHAPWHTAYHQINDDARDREDVKNGKLDWVHNDPSMKEVSKAVHKIQAEGKKTRNTEKPQQCNWCKQPATKSMLWAEGMGYIPTCDKHEAKTRHHIEDINDDEVVAIHQIKQGAKQPYIGKGWWLTPEGKKIGVYDHYETTPGMARQMIRPHMAESGQVRVRSFNNQLNVQTSRPFTDAQRQSLLLDADKHSRMFVDVLHPDTEESIHSASGGPEDADRLLNRAHRAAIPHTAALTFLADVPYAGGHKFQFIRATPKAMGGSTSHHLQAWKEGTSQADIDDYNETAQGMYFPESETGPEGQISWKHHNGEIKNIAVRPSAQRQGLATELLDRAREVAATTRGVKPPRHSWQRTDAGDAWARSTGDRLPGRRSGLGEFVSVFGQPQLFDPGSGGHEHLPNPRGGHDWFHGTPHHFENFGEERPEEDDPYGGYDFETGEKFKQPHWNTHLGQHWTSLRGVAEHFAKGQYGQVAEGKGHVITARLGIQHPKDYKLESDMDREAFEHAWDGHDPHDYHDEFCHNPEHRDDPDEEHFDDEPYHYNDEHERGDEVDRQVKQRYIDGNHQGEWLSQHPDSGSLAESFKDKVRQEGHDGITYGNELEGPHGHQCAITFDDHQIHDQRRRSLARLAAEGHETYYHLTDNPKFEPDPEKVPEDNSITLNRLLGPERKGLYVTKNPERWINGYDYVRPYVAEIHAKPEHVQGGEYGGEGIIPAEHLDKAKVHRVIPVDAHAREEYGEHGWIESHHGTTFDTHEPITEQRGPSPLRGYHYDGPDVRDMPKAQTDEHKQRWLQYLKENRSFDDESIEHYRAHTGMADRGEYGMEHSPYLEGPALHELGHSYPDIYDHPEYYGSMHERPGRESARALKRAKGIGPDDQVSIYRAAPHGVTTFNHGDWVTLSPGYAQQHSRHPTDESRDMPIYKAQVAARHVHWDENDINEFGYSGPEVPATKHLPGGPDAPRLAAFVAALDPGQVSETSPEEFHRRFSQAMEGSPFVHHVTNHTPEEIRSGGMRPLTTNGGDTGVLVHDHGDGRIEATGLYNRSKVKGAGVDLLKHTMAHHGVNYVEAYGPKLPQLYRKAGFQTTEKYRFDRDQADPGWNFRQFDSPSYHIMRPRNAQKSGKVISWPSTASVLSPNPLMNLIQSLQTSVSSTSTGKTLTRSGL
jgi:8-oxo-dGTP pyrophosphatase MutT (NUDIX family)/GNAT superfamily N-acetyltransferase